MTDADSGKNPKRFTCLYCYENTQCSEPSATELLFTCSRCGWWQLIAGSRAYGLLMCILYRGALKQYSIDALDVPLTELRAYLRRHPHDIALVNPIAFERLIAECLREKYDPCEVVHVGGSSDRGIDIILIRLEEGPRLIQVKRRGNIHAAEGVQVVRELNGVLFREGVYKGMIITTAERFTKPALDETSIWTPTGERYDMKLLSYLDVVELFNVEPTLPHRPWLPFLKPASE